MATMLDYLQRLLPPWIAQGPLVTIGGKVYQRTVAAFGQVADDLRNDAAFGVREAMLEECTDDALPAHLRNSNLPVYATEQAVVSRDVLRSRWNLWRGSGGYETMLAALARLGYSNATIWSTLDLLVAGAPRAFGGLNNFFYVEIGQPNQWNRGDLWDGGKRYLDDRALWGLGGGTREDLEALIFVIQKFKPATSSCRYVTIDVGGGIVRTIPMWEWWEYDPATGSYPSYYNLTYLDP